MRSFRKARRRKSFSPQVVITIIILLAATMLVRTLSVDTVQQAGADSLEENLWKSSVIEIP